MATTDDFYPVKFLKPADLDGEEVFVIVHEVGKDTFKNDDGTEVRKPIIYWRENVKPLIVNKTNFVRISEVAGRDTDDWSGTKLVLYADRVAMQSTRSACARRRRLRPSRW